MQRERDLTSLQHILDAAREAVGFSTGRARADLNSDRMLERAIEMSLQIIGEAAGELSTDLRAKYPLIPWAKMTATRNRIVHAYMSIDLDTVWAIVTADLPPLIKQIEAILTKERGLL